LQQEQTEQNGIDLNMECRNRNEFIGKSGDLLLRRRKRSFRRAGGWMGSSDMDNKLSGAFDRNYMNNLINVKNGE